MSLLLIGITALLVAAFWVRLHVRARRAMAAWAEENRYRLLSASLETMFEARPADRTQPPDLVYEVRVSTESGTIHDGQLLIWNVMFGRAEVLVRWSAHSCIAGM
jgi:hypothetical protein